MRVVMNYVPVCVESPVSESRIEYEVHKFIAYLLTQIILHINQQQRRAELTIGRETLVYVVGRIDIVGVFYVYSDCESGLCGICILTHRLGRESVSRDFARDFGIGVAIDDLQASLTGDGIHQPVLEFLLQRWVHECCANRELRYVYCLVQVIIYGRSVQLIADAA